jgi:hypothetical protein
VSAPATRVGVAAIGRRKAEEVPKTNETGEMRAPKPTPAEIPEPGGAEYHRKPKRGLFDDPGCIATGGILLQTTGQASASRIGDIAAQSRMMQDADSRMKFVQA